MIRSLIIKKIKSNLQENKPSGRIIDLHNARSILFLFEISDYQLVQDLERALTNEGKFCEFVVFSEVKEKTYPQINGLIFSNKELSFWGFPKQEVIEKYSTIVQKTDILIDLSMHNYLPLCYLISLFKVKLKIGIRKEGFDLFDFMIDAPKNMDLKFLSEQIMFYLRRLKS